MKKIFLIYGNNQPLIHFREQQILKQFKENFANTLHILEFSKEPSSPSTNEPSFFDPITKVHIHISREAHLIQLESLTPFFDLPHHHLLLISSKINSKSKILSFLHGHRSVQIYKCYDLQMADFKEIVLSFLTPRQIKISAPALALLYASMENRMDALFMELEKIALFGMNEREITVEDIAAMGHQKIPHDMIEFTQAVLQRHLTEFSKILTPILKAGHEPIALIRHLLQHFSSLQKLLVKTQEGFSFEQAFSHQKPPIFFALKELYQHALKLWSFQELQKTLLTLIHLEKDLKLYPQIVKELFFERLFLIMKK